MKTSSAKAKGRRLALEVKTLLHKHVPVLDGDDIRVTPSGVPGVDIQFSPHAKHFYPISIECKNQESLQIWAALAQAETNTEKDTAPVLFFKRNNSKIYACLDADLLIKLMSLL